MTDADSREPLPPLRFGAALGVIAYLGCSFLYLHLAGLLVAHQFAGDPDDTWNAYFGAGRALISDIGWVVPTAVASILAAYVALFGGSILPRGFGRSTRDFAVLACLAIASILLGYSTTTAAALLASGTDASRAFPLVGFTVFAVLLAARAGTAFWGSPSKQVRTAVDDLAEMRAMRLRLTPPSTSPKGRVIALFLWTAIPLLFPLTQLTTSNALPAVVLASGASLLLFPLLVWRLTYYVRYRAISRKPLNQTLNMVSLALTAVSAGILVFPIWIFSSVVGRAALTILVFVIVAAALLPRLGRYALGSLGRDLAYVRLSKRIPRAEQRTLHARSRLMLDSSLADFANA